MRPERNRVESLGASPGESELVGRGEAVVPWEGEGVQTRGDSVETRKAGRRLLRVTSRTCEKV